MGASKRVMELLVKEYSLRNPRTILSTVRFGNVFNSAGSVIRLFRMQIDTGGPITITDEEAERFFMSVTEAAQLGIQAGAFSESGDVFVLDMGDPIKIMDIAQEMCKLSGYELGTTLPLEIIGLGNGEKLDEQLMRTSEQIEETPNERVKKLIDESVSWKDMQKDLILLNKLATDFDRGGILKVLRRIVPEFNQEAK